MGDKMWRKSSFVIRGLPVLTMLLLLLLLLLLKQWILWWRWWLLLLRFPFEPFLSISGVFFDQRRSQHGLLERDGHVTGESVHLRDVVP